MTYMPASPRQMFAYRQEHSLKEQIVSMAIDNPDPTIHITATPRSSPKLTGNHGFYSEFNSNVTYYEIDPEVKMAAEALGSISQDMAMYSDQSMEQAADPQHFMQRVSNIPLVNQSLHQIGAAYEATKKYSTVVKYSAETVESSVRSISQPVINTVAPALAPLDRFACNQLDKLEKSFPRIIGQNSHEKEALSSSYFASLPEAKRIRTQSIDSSMSLPTSMATDMQSWPSSPKVSAEQSLPSTVGSSPMLPNFSTLYNDTLYQQNPAISRNTDTLVNALSTTTAPHIDRKPRSRWSQVVAGVGENFGSMVISSEMMRGLKYCLRWLQYASAKVDRQIALLLSWLRRNPDLPTEISADRSSQPTPPMSPFRGDTLIAAAAHDSRDFRSMLQNIKNDIVAILKRVVDVIGKYAAVYLPFEARRRVKGFILALPGRWATINGTDAEASVNYPQPNSSQTEAQRVLSLATESSTMLKSVSNVFSQSVDAAEMVLGTRTLDTGYSASAGHAMCVTDQQETNQEGKEDQPSIMSWN